MNMNPSDNPESDTCSETGTFPSGGVPYSSDVARRWEKIHNDAKQLPLIGGVRGTTVEAVYENTPIRRRIPHDHPLPVVGFSCMKREPTDKEIPGIVDDAITQVLGPQGLTALIRK